MTIFSRIAIQKVLKKYKCARLLTWIVIPFLLIISTKCYSAEMYRSDPNIPLTIDEHDICKQITNESTNSYFIPTKTKIEWEEFILAASSEPGITGVTLSECNVHMFLLTKNTYDGDLGGMSGANQICLNEVNDYDWKGKPEGATFSSTEVKAFLCSTSTCTNLLPDTEYRFGVIDSPDLGGDSFMTDSFGRGPDNQEKWGTNTKFFPCPPGGPCPTWWSNRGSASTSRWKTTPEVISPPALATYACTDYTSSTSAWRGFFGSISNYSGSQRWHYPQDQPCTTLRHLICAVDCDL